MGSGDLLHPGQPDDQRHQHHPGPEDPPGERDFSSSSSSSSSSSWSAACHSQGGGGVGGLQQLVQQIGWLVEAHLPTRRSGLIYVGFPSLSPQALPEAGPGQRLLPGWTCSSSCRTRATWPSNSGRWEAEPLHPGQPDDQRRHQHRADESSSRSRPIYRAAAPPVSDVLALQTEPPGPEPARGEILRKAG